MASFFPNGGYSMITPKTDGVPVGVPMNQAEKDSTHHSLYVAGHFGGEKNESPFKTRRTSLFTSHAKAHGSQPP